MSAKDPFERALEGKTTDQQLQFLYHRRQAINNLIRSLEVVNRAKADTPSSEPTTYWPAIVA